MKQLPTTVVLQDLGDRNKSKSRCVFKNGSEKSKNWEWLSPNLAKPQNVVKQFSRNRKKTKI